MKKIKNVCMGLILAGIFITLLNAQDNFDDLFGLSEEDSIQETTDSQPVDEFNLWDDEGSGEAVDDLFLFPEEILETSPDTMVDTEADLVQIPAPGEKPSIKPETEKSFVVAVGIASPTLASVDLMTWNSMMDIRMSARFPLVILNRFHVGADISSFRFENALPQGGLYSGIAAFISLEKEFSPGLVSGGAGIVGKAPGFYLQQSYGITLAKRFPVRLNARVLFTSDIDGKGWGNWLELGLSGGFIVF